MFNRLDPFAGDSLDPQSLHKYLYANGDPIGFVDPSGLFGVVGVAAGSSIGASLNGLTAQIGESVAQSLGYNLATDPIGIIFDPENGILPASFFATVEKVQTFLMENPKTAGIGFVTAIVGAAVFQNRASLAAKLRHYHATVADAIVGTGRRALRTRMSKLEATGLFTRIKSPTQNIVGLQGTERQFIKTLFEKHKKTNLVVYRAKREAGTGDFVIIDASNPATPKIIALEHKLDEARGFAGDQLTPDGARLLHESGFNNVEMITANTDQFLDHLKIPVGP